MSSAQTDLKILSFCGWLNSGLVNVWMGRMVMYWVQVLTFFSDGEAMGTRRGSQKGLLVRCREKGPRLEQFMSTQESCQSEDIVPSRTWPPNQGDNVIKERMFWITLMPSPGQVGPVLHETLWCLSSLCQSHGCSVPLCWHCVTVQGRGVCQRGVCRSWHPGVKVQHVELQNPSRQGPVCWGTCSRSQRETLNCPQCPRGRTDKSLFHCGTTFHRA